MAIKREGLKDLSLSQEKVLASDIRSDILSTAYIHGGHLSSNLGIVELTLGLLRAFDPYKDDILFDVGHQTYAYKILTGRDLKTLRQYNGEPPFSEPSSSKADKYRNGHASTALSVGYGMALAKGLSGDKSHTVVVIGDASLASGIAMECLGLLSNDKKTRLILVINDNGMSIGKDVSFVGKEFRKLRNSRFYFRTSNFLGRAMGKSKITWKMFLHLRNLKDKVRQIVLKPTVFESMGLKYIGPFDGHDLEALDLAFKKAKALVQNGPVVVHIITKKGYGYPPAMKDEKGAFHGVSRNFDEEKPEDKDNFVTYKTDFLIRKMEEDDKAFVICPAMVYGSGLEEIYSKYPKRCLDVGIAEENAVTLASGLALKGYHPIVDIYSTFLQRSYDEVFEDISRERCDNFFFVERSGLTGEDGSSHQGLYDVAFLRSIPYCRVFMPYDKKSFQHIAETYWFDKKVPTFLRCPKDKPANSHSPVQVEDGFDILKKAKNDVLLLATGPKGMLFLEKMKEEKADSFLLWNLLPNEEVLSKLDLLSYKAIFFFDVYSIREGTSDHIASYLSRNGYNGHFRSETFLNDFVSHGSVETLYRVYRLDVDSVVEKAKDFLADIASMEKER